MLVRDDAADKARKKAAKSAAAAAATEENKDSSIKQDATCGKLCTTTSIAGALTNPSKPRAVAVQSEIKTKQQAAVVSREKEDATEAAAEEGGA